MFCCIGLHADEMFRADGDTFPTCLTFLLIHHCHSIFYMDSIKGTDLGTGAKAQAAVVAGFCTTVRYELEHPAILDSGILIVHTGFLAITLAMNKSNHFLTALCLNTHDLSNLFAHSVTAYRTGIHRSLSLGNRCSQSGTTGEAAASAVISGQCIQNLLFFFIHFYFELDCCHA